VIVRSRQERIILARAVTRLMNEWRLTPANQLRLLGPLHSQYAIVIPLPSRSSTAASARHARSGRPPARHFSIPSIALPEESRASKGVVHLRQQTVRKPVAARYRSEARNVRIGHDTINACSQYRRTVGCELQFVVRGKAHHGCGADSLSVARLSHCL
jgi:hypothetical protein